MGYVKKQLLILGVGCRLKTSVSLKAFYILAVFTIVLAVLRIILAVFGNYPFLLIGFISTNIG